MAAWKECARTGNIWYREHRMMGVDGKYHAILAQGVPIRDEDGRIQRWAGINLDISRLKNTELALLEADRRKDEFLATLAHELRNPLAPIRNAVRILDSDAADERQRKWGREVIARQVQRMSLLLDDLLDVSRITRGQLELKNDYVDLKSVVDVAVETARPLLDAKRHHLTVSLPAENVKLEADPLRLSQVIGNLLTNAAKYTDPEGQITLQAKLANTELVISILDDGIGLSPEVIPGLFTMFSQVNSAIDRAEGGLGIGLALVKGLVALHGGRVEARSEGLGKGSEFIVHLPHKVIAPAGAVGVADTTSSARNAAASAARACWSPTTTAMPPSRWRSCSSSRATKSSPRSTARGARDRRPRTATRRAHRHRHARHEWTRGRAPHAARSLGKECRADRASPAGARTRTNKPPRPRVSTST